MYSKGKSNLNDARASSGGQGGLTVDYKVDLTKMDKNPEVAKSVAEKKF